MYRIGIGYDIHRLAARRKLFLGGIEIPHAKGLLGHSDADVLLHAVCDALLGAAALGDIGEHFPDSDPAYKGIDSCELLSRVLAMVRGRGFLIGNIDVVVIAEEPKLGPFKKQIGRKIGEMLGVDPAQVGIKAKTNEKLGELGAGKAIACHAAVLLYKE